MVATCVWRMRAREGGRGGGGGGALLVLSCHGQLCVCPCFLLLYLILCVRVWTWVCGCVQKRPSTAAVDNHGRRCNGSTGASLHRREACGVRAACAAPGVRRHCRCFRWRPNRWDGTATLPSAPNAIILIVCCCPPVHSVPSSRSRSRSRSSAQRQHGRGNIRAGGGPSRTAARSAAGNGGGEASSGTSTTRCAPRCGIENAFPSLLVCVCVGGCVWGIADRLRRKMKPWSFVLNWRRWCVVCVCVCVWHMSVAHECGTAAWLCCQEPMLSNECGVATCAVVLLVFVRASRMPRLMVSQAATTTRVMTRL